MTRRYLIMGTALMFVSPVALGHLPDFHLPTVGPSYHTNPVYAS